MPRCGSSKIGNFLSAPRFCDFLAWRAGTTRPGQYGALCAHISQATVHPQLLSIYTRRRQHLQKGNTSEEWREVSHYQLCQAKTVRVWTCIYFSPRLYFSRHLYFGQRLYFSRRLYFVGAYVLVSAYILVGTYNLVGAYILVVVVEKICVHNTTKGGV